MGNDKPALLSRVRRKTLSNIRDYQEVFGTPAGERVLVDIVVKRCGVLNTSLPKSGKIDPNEVLVREGERRVGQLILNTLGVDLQKLRETYEQQERYSEHE